MIAVVSDTEIIWRAFTPVVKAGPTSDDRYYRVAGVASTASRDQQNEIVLQKGIDAAPLLERGIINWNHMSTAAPGAIIGKPERAQLNPDGNFEIEAVLYKGLKAAEDAWELLNYYDDHPDLNRALGWSIEGSGMRKGNVVTKTIVRHVALTHDMVNTDTLASVVKAMCPQCGLDGCELTPLSKAMTTQGSQPLMLENLDSGRMTSLLRDVFFGKNSSASTIFEEREGKLVYRNGPLSAHQQLVAMGMDPNDAKRLLIDLRDSRILG